MKKFFTKKYIRLIALVLVVATIVISCPVIMLSSKIAYNKYYDAAIKEKEYKKWLNSLPLELKSITVALADGKEFYADGLANPKKSDLEVRAQFTEKGSDFEKILNDEDFLMTVGEDFAENGGKIAVEYSFVPEKKTEEEVDPEPMVKTAEIDVTLTKVQLVSIELCDLPYRVYYSDDMEFSVDGMTVTASYNNGGKAVIPSDKLVSVGKGKLKAGDEKEEVAFTLDGITRTTEVPVTVVKAAEYSDGKILSIKTDDELTISDGTKLSEVKTGVRATYENGNRLLLSDGDYSVTGNTEYADFSKNCLLTISHSANANIFCKTVAKVTVNTKAENVTLDGAKIKEVNGVKAATEFSSTGKLSYTIRSNGLAKGNLTVRIANLGDKKINLGEVLTLNVNGEKLYVSKLLAVKENDGFNEYLLPATVLFSGDNSISLSVKEGTELAVFDFTYETCFGGSFYSNINEYLSKTELPRFDVEKLTEWNNDTKAYMHGLVSDGAYIYGVCTSYQSGATRSLVVKKIDFTTGKVVATSKETEKFSCEDFAGISYIDGKIVVFANDGKKYYTDSDTLQNPWNLFVGFDIGDYKDEKMSDAAFVVAKRSYVFRISALNESYKITENRVDIVGVNGEKKLSFVPKDVKDYVLTRIFASGDYIYASYKKDKAHQPYVVVYDYDGNVVNEFSVSYDVSLLSEATGYNVQGIALLNDSLYFSVIKWEPNAAQIVLKADYPKLVDELEVNLTFGEYAKACEMKGKTATTTASIATPDATSLKKVIGFSMGGASDGENMYLVVNDGNNVNATVYKIDPLTYEVKANTIAEVTSTEKKRHAAKVFIKDGKIFLIPSVTMPNMLYGIELDKFTGFNVTMDKYDLPFVGLNFLTDATYSSDTEKYAVLVNNLYSKTSGEGVSNKLYFYDKTGKTIIKELSVAYKSWFAASVTSDSKYVYVSYISDGQEVTPIDVYDWDGNKITTIEVSGVKFEDNTVKKHSTTSIFTHGGNLYASLIDWRNGYFTYYLYKISIDISVLS